MAEQDDSKSGELLHNLHEEIIKLNKDIEKATEPELKLADQPLVKASKEVTKHSFTLKVKRILKGHFGKIYAFQWSSDSVHLVSASQDGKLIIWNGFTTNKVHAIPLRSSWVMTCAYSPSRDLVACGGLDNLCSVYKITGGKDPITSTQKTFAELSQHEGYLSCCRFIGDDEIITASGDSTCILWDIEKRKVKNVFPDHTRDVMSVSIADKYFVSGSVDTYAKLWDHRSKKACIATFHGHDSDINAVAFVPNDDTTFASCSDDATCRLFSVKARKQINKYADDKILCGITCCAFSIKGRALFAGYDDHTCYAWDTLKGELSDQLMGHENRVSSLGVSPDGMGLCTGSWDHYLKIWA